MHCWFSRRCSVSAPQTGSTEYTANGSPFPEKPSTWPFTRSSDYTRYSSLSSISFPTSLCSSSDKNKHPKRNPECNRRALTTSHGFCFLRFGQFLLTAEFHSCVIPYAPLAGLRQHIHDTAAVFQRACSSLSLTNRINIVKLGVFEKVAVMDRAEKQRKNGVCKPAMV